MDEPTGPDLTPADQAPADQTAGRAARETGLRDCLRANLHRRKQQARARAVHGALTGARTGALTGAPRPPAGRDEAG